MPHPADWLLNSINEGRRLSLGNAIFRGMSAFVLVFVCMTSSPVQAQSSGSEYSGTFRPGHNITVALGIQQSRWSLNLATLKTPLTTERFNAVASVNYGFHFQVYQRFGFVLGTAMHSVLDRTAHNGFSPSVGVLLPSILGGIVQSLGSDVRLLLTSELGLAWYPYSLWRVAGTQSTYEGGVLDQIAISSQLDWGLQKRNVFSLIAGWRLSADHLVGEKVIVANDGASFPQMQHEGWFMALGVTRQVTETLTGVQGGN